MPTKEIILVNVLRELIIFCLRVMNARRFVYFAGIGLYFVKMKFMFGEDKHLRKEEILEIRKK